MANPHRTNVLVTSCLRTPVDPHTRAPLASYERRRARPNPATRRQGNRELENEDSGSDFCDEIYSGRGGPRVTTDRTAAGERLDLSEIFFSNEEYYSKLEELKKAHLRTMAELENMYRRKLQLKAMEPLDPTLLETPGTRPPRWDSSPSAPRRLRKSHSAVELRRAPSRSDSSSSSEEEEKKKDNAIDNAGSGLIFSPKEHIKNMWRDFNLSPHNRHLLSSSVRSLPLDQESPREGRGRRRPPRGGPGRGPTVPKPFHMTQREAERQKRGPRARAAVERENAELRRQLEELTECQRKFRAGPVPAHVHLPLYDELRGRKEERRRARELEDQHPPAAAQKPFSFLERERLKKEQRQLHPPRPSGQEKVKPFRAKPVPRAVYAAATGEQMKEEQLYRSIKIQMRAQEMLHSAAMPPSMLARRLSDRKKPDVGGGGGGFSHRPHINAEVPDFDASYRRFQRHLERQKEVKPTTACEPFELRTARIPSHRERVLADIERGQSSPRAGRRPPASPAPARRATSSRCSSLSGSLEVLPTKDTDASKKREEAVRKLLEQRRRADEEEERWRERQKQREKKLQRVVLKRAQANDPHLALSQTQPTKLREFRKQELQRKKEYQQEFKEMQQRVKGRPLLLEQVTQSNAKQAAGKRYADALRACDLTEEFVSSTAAKSGAARKASTSSDYGPSEGDEPDTGYKPVHYRKVLRDDSNASLNHREGGGGASRHSDGDRHGNDDDDDNGDSQSEESYSDDQENYSDDSDHEPGDARQEAGE